MKGNQIQGSLRHPFWMGQLRFLLELVCEEEHGVCCIDETVVEHVLDDIACHALCLAELNISWRGDCGNHPAFRSIFKRIIALQQKQQIYKKLIVKTRQKEVVDYILQLCTEGPIAGECHLYTDIGIQSDKKGNLFVHYEDIPRVVAAKYPFSCTLSIEQRFKMLEQKNICNAPWYTPCVTAAGDLTYCSHDVGEQAIIGSVLTGSFVELWNNKAISAIRCKAVKQEEMLEAFCVNCSMDCFMTDEEVIRYLAITGKQDEARYVANKIGPDEGPHAFVRNISNRNKLSICLLSREYPPETAWGGIGMYAYRLAHGLAAAGHVVHVIVETYDDDKEFFDGDVHVHKIRNWHLFRDEDRYPEWTRRFEYADRIAQKINDIQERYGLHIVESPNFHGEGYLYSLMKKIPLVTRLHSTYEDIVHYQRWTMSTDSRMSSLVEERLIEKSDAVTCSTRAHADLVLRDNAFLRSRVHIIPLGVSLPELVTKKRDERLRILFVGRLEHRKGVDVLIDALSMILHDNSNVFCDIVGRDTFSSDTSIAFEGDKGQSYLEMLKNRLPHDLHSRVVFHGYVNEHALAGFYGNCDIFVAPSRYESCGFIYLEALSYGKPVVGCDVGGVPEVVRNGETGVLVEGDNSEQLAAAIIDLIQDEGKRLELGAAGRAYIEHNHTIERMVSQTEELYRSLL